MAIALQKSRISIGPLPMLIALLAAMLIGGAAGYAAKDHTAPAAASAISRASVCAVGTHPVVWYTAGAWACIEDGE